MADIYDVLTAVATTATAACYPDGTAVASVSGKPITIAPGWPIAEQLNNGFKADPPQSFISIWPLSGSSAIEQVMSEPVVIVPPVHGLGASLDDTGLVATITGYPNPKEYLTFVVDHKKSYSVAATGGADDLRTITSAVAQQVAVDYPGTFSADGVITNTREITVIGAQNIIVRIGAPGTMGEIIHRQKQQVQVTVWAPTPTDRMTIGRAVDVALKNALRLRMPDTSACILTYNSTIFDDSRENAGTYRQDMIYLADYLTINPFTAYEVTSFTARRTDVTAPDVVL